MAGSQNPFEESELNILKSYLQNGGRILVLLSESNENDTGNVNILLEDIGIVPNMGTKNNCTYIAYLQINFQFSIIGSIHYYRLLNSHPLLQVFSSEGVLHR